MADDAATLLERFNRSWKGIDRVYHEIARRSGLSDCAFWILYALRDAGTTMLQNELSQVWLYSRQTVSSTLRQMEERGLVEVAYVPGSRRDKEISLTDDGRRFTETYVAPAMAAEEAALTALSPADRDMLITGIDRYAALLEAAVESMRMPTATSIGSDLAADGPERGDDERGGTAADGRADADDKTETDDKKGVTTT